MKNSIRNKNHYFLMICILLLVCFFVYILSGLRILEMSSSSMEPLVSGAGIPPVRSGDIVIIYNRVSHPLKKNEIVSVLLKTTNSTETIRRVVGIPGDPMPDFDNTEQTGSEKRIGNGYYYLLGENTNSIDSRKIGLFSCHQITGKVLFIIPMSQH